jgi:hypothetical protein
MKFAYSFVIEEDRVSNKPKDLGEVSNLPHSVPGSHVHEHWLFDLDGCLVDSFDGTSLRPLARELIEALLQHGHSVDIWSAGGAEYAERVARRVGISDLIGTFWTKDRGPSGKWTLPPELSGQIVCVDDQPDGVPPGVEKIAVFPYLGPNPHDQVLHKLLDRATSFIAPL